MVQQTSASRLIKEAGIGQSGRQEISNNASLQLADKLKLVPEELEKPLMDKMAEIYENNRRIRIQSKELTNRTSNLRTLTHQWKALSKNVDSKVKEFGDVQNWAELIDQELRVLEETIKITTSNRT